MKGSNISFYIFAAGVMFLMLYSLHAYFLWWMYDSFYYPLITDFVVAFLGLSYMNNRKIPYRLNTKALIVFILIWIVAAWQVPGLVFVFKCPFSLLVLLLLDKKTLLLLLDIWTTLYALILLVSFIAWPLALAGLLPLLGVINFGHVDAYYYLNYIVCLVNVNLVNFDVIRFCSIFLEPGHISMIGAFTLYVNRFNFKKWTVWVILFVSLVALSLAGYVLIAVGYLFIHMQRTGLLTTLRSAIVSIFVLLAVYFAAISYKGGNNLVNTLIFERLEYDKESVIVGNNRVFGDTDVIFEKLLVSRDIFTGLKPNLYKKYTKDRIIGGAGYKMYILETGLIGTFLVFIGYMLIYSRASDKRFVFFFLLLYILAFWQRAWPTSHIWLFLFVFATAVISRKQGSSVKVSL